jgi:predicted NAD/FAD-binding protein
MEHLSNVKLKRMAIIGGGASGLTTAFLTQHQYEITLFEKNNYLGGNALTHYEDSFPNEMGATAFNQRSYPYFTRLLEMLKIETINLSQNNIYTYHNKNTGVQRILNNTFPKSLLNLSVVLQIRRLRKEILKRDPQTLCGEFFNSLSWFDQKIKNEILYPFLSFLTITFKKDLDMVPISQLMAVLELTQFHQPFEVSGQRVRNGMSSYINKLVSLLHIKINLNTPVMKIEKIENFWKVNGEEFDLLVMSCDPHTVYKLLPSYFPYFKDVTVLNTTIDVVKNGIDFNSFYTAIDYDMDYVFYEKQSIDNPNTNLITLSVTVPSKAIDEATFRHTLIDSKMISARTEFQIEEAKLNQEGLYLIGAYLEASQLHEQAIYSAVKLSDKLSPSSYAVKEIKQIKKVTTKWTTKISNFIFNYLLSPVYFLFR